MRGPTSRIAAAVAVLVLGTALGAAALPTASTAATRTTAQTTAPVAAVTSAPSYACGTNPGKRQIVLLVHGFFSSPATWSKKSQAYLASNTTNTCVVTFDYADHSTDWVPSQFIGPALAAQIKSLATRSRSQGGPGKLVVVAHSMGGLAMRCAVADSCSHNHAVASDISALVTFGTPNLGTGLKGSGRSLLSDIIGPTWSGGCQTLQALGEVPPGSCDMFEAFGTSDAGHAFTPGSGELKALPPLSATSSFPVTAVAGRVHIVTMDWGQYVALGDAGDLVVNEDSALAEARPTGGIGGPVTIDCGEVNLFLGIQAKGQLQCWHSDETNNQQFLTVALHTITKVEQATAAQRHVTVTRAGAFLTPSGNIVCLMTGTLYSDPASQHQVRCDIFEWDYKTPQRPADCPTDYGHAFQFDNDGKKALVLCAGDSIAGAAVVGGTEVASADDWFQPGVDKKVHLDTETVGGNDWASLGYGSTMREGNNLCDVETDGVTCTNTVTGHGFFVSRGAYRGF